MGISVSILLIAVGAILTWGVTAEAEGLDVNAIGVILMIVGVLGLVISMLFWSSWGGFRRRDRPRRAGRRSGRSGAEAHDRGRGAGRCSRPASSVALEAAKHRPSEVAGDVPGDLRVLLQPAERVLVPLAAEGHVDAKAVPLGHEPVAELRADSEQHLELVAARGEPRSRISRSDCSTSHPSCVAIAA